jgi:hypothetical protein
MRNACRNLIGNTGNKRTLLRPRRRWKYNIKIAPIDIGYKDIDWIQLVQDKVQWFVVVKKVINIRVL